MSRNHIHKSCKLRSWTQALSKLSFMFAPFLRVSSRYSSSFMKNSNSVGLLGRLFTNTSKRLLKSGFSSIRHFFNGLAGAPVAIKCFHYAPSGLRFLRGACRDRLVYNPPMLYDKRIRPIRDLYKSGFSHPCNKRNLRKYMLINNFKNMSLSGRHF